jgi:hypothetical protein
MEIVSRTAAPSATSRENPSALPEAWIDKLFARFAVMYGKHWLELWSGIPMEAVKAGWAEDLAGTSGEQLRRALDHCKANSKFPPTCPEFLQICRQFRDTPAHALYLPAPRGELPPATKVILDGLVAGRGDCKAWARKILEQSGKGVVYPSISLEFAKEALGLAP